MFSFVFWKNPWPEKNVSRLFYLYYFGTFWWTAIHRRIFFLKFPLRMLILGQKACFLGPNIFEIPRLNWYYSLIQKNGYTFAIVYGSKCVTVFLNQTLVSIWLKNDFWLRTNDFYFHFLIGFSFPFSNWSCYYFLFLLVFIVSIFLMVSILFFFIGFLPTVFSFKSVVFMYIFFSL